MLAPHGLRSVWSGSKNISETVAAEREAKEAFRAHPSPGEGLPANSGAGDSGDSGGGGDSGGVGGGGANAGVVDGSIGVGVGVGGGAAGAAEATGVDVAGAGAAGVVAGGGGGGGGGSVVAAAFSERGSSRVPFTRGRLVGWPQGLGRLAFSVFFCLVHFCLFQVLF